MEHKHIDALSRGLAPTFNRVAGVCAQSIALETKERLLLQTNPQQLLAELLKSTPEVTHTTPINQVIEKLRALSPTGQQRNALLQLEAAWRQYTQTLFQNAKQSHFYVMAKETPNYTSSFFDHVTLASALEEPLWRTYCPGMRFCADYAIIDDLATYLKTGSHTTRRKRKRKHDTESTNNNNNNDSDSDNHKRAKHTEAQKGPQLALGYANTLKAWVEKARPFAQRRKMNRATTARLKEALKVIDTQTKLISDHAAEDVTNTDTSYDATCNRIMIQILNTWVDEITQGRHTEMLEKVRAMVQASNAKTADVDTHIAKLAEFHAAHTERTSRAVTQQLELEMTQVVQRILTGCDDTTTTKSVSDACREMHSQNERLRDIRFGGDASEEQEKKERTNLEKKTNTHCAIKDCSVYLSHLAEIAENDKTTREVHKARDAIAETGTLPPHRRNTEETKHKAMKQAHDETHARLKGMRQRAVTSIQTNLHKPIQSLVETMERDAETQTDMLLLLPPSPDPWESANVLGNGGVDDSTILPLQKAAAEAQKHCIHTLSPVMSELPQTVQAAIRTHLAKSKDFTFDQDDISYHAIWESVSGLMRVSALASCHAQ